MATTKIDNPNLFDFTSLNTALQLPTGDTASRPSAPSTGEWRYNNETKYVEYWDSTEWREIDTETPPIEEDFPEKNFNTNTYNGTGANQTINGKFNEAATFGGVGGSSGPSNTGLITLPNNSNFDLGASTSLSFWAKRNVSTCHIINKGNPESYAFWWGTNYYLTLYDSGGSSTSLITSTANTTDTWYHFVITVDSAGTGFKLYMNANEEASTTFGPIRTNTSDVRIGSYPNGTYTFGGAIDQIRWFNTTLSQSQIDDLYAETTTTAATLNYPTGAGCVAAYQLDGNVSDLSGTYGGTDSYIRYTGFQFQPDFIWIKTLSSGSHYIFDTLRGNYTIYSNLSSGQSDWSTAIDITSSNLGFQLIGSSSSVNHSSQDYVAWCWKAGGAPTTDNVAGVGNVPTSGSVKVDGADSTASLTGTIVAKKISANTKAGFSIIQYDGTGTAGTMDHLLGVEPNLVIVKRTDSAGGNWIVGSTEIDSNSWTKILQLDLDDPVSTYTGFNDTAPTSSVFSLGSNNPVNNSSGDYIAYCFANVNGYQKIGSYTGNGSTNGPIINTGFEPAFLVVKNKDIIKYWYQLDNKRTPTNPRNKELYPNRNDSEQTVTGVDFLTNGFQIITSDSGFNSNGDDYLYWAIAADVESAPTLTKSFAIDQWTGTGANQNIYSLIGPEFVWIKDKGNPEAHALFDIIRGANKALRSNGTQANTTFSNSLESFNPNGYTLGTDGAGFVNYSGRGPYIGWSWKASELPAINTEGSITSIVSANQAAGFSAVKYRGTGSATTIGHGLSSAPELIFVKTLDTVDNWMVLSTAVGATKKASLNANNEFDTDSAPWNDTAPTSTLFTVGTKDATNKNGDDFIAYCWHSVSGYSKVGSYTGNGTSKIIYTTDDGTSGGANGFQPDFVLVKRTDNTSNWVIVDSVRGVNQQLYPNLSNADNTDSNGVQSFNSNGFTVGSGSDFNASGDYIYLALKLN